MPPSPEPLDADLAELTARGYLVLRGVLGRSRIAELRAELERALARKGTDAAILRRGGTVFAVRGLLELWPAVEEVLRQAPVLRGLIAKSVGRPAEGETPRVGIVRSMLFDKPPTASWFVPWHRDLTIAVRSASDLPRGYSHPTRKHGVTHLEAPSLLLESMLTVRLHLDDAGETNGALSVVPGSHRPAQGGVRPVGSTDGQRRRIAELHRESDHTGGALELACGASETLLEVEAGDVVVMRPRLIHSSRTTDRGSHRRVLHFELADASGLAPPLEWARFWPLGESGPGHEGSR